MTDTVTISIADSPAELRAAIADIAAERSAPLTPADLRELADAHEAKQQALTRGKTDADAESAAAPSAHLRASVGIPGAVLHRPTYGARIWLLAADNWPIPDAWRDHRAEWVNLVAAFVLAHAYDEDVLGAVSTAEQMHALVVDWGRTLPATVDDVSDAVSQLTDGAYPPVPPDGQDAPSAPASTADGGGQKKNSTPTRSPRSCARLCGRLEGPRSTGSGRSPSHTCAGSCGSISANPGSRPEQQAAQRRPTGPTIPESEQQEPGGRLSTASNQETDS